MRHVGSHFIMRYSIVIRDSIVVEPPSCQSSGSGFESRPRRTRYVKIVSVDFMLRAAAVETGLDGHWTSK